jgi:acyl-CoA dehydrogenase
MGLVAKVTVWSELARSIALPSRAGDIFGPNVSPILYHLNAEQKQRYLLPTIRGELNWCLAQTEPDAGGDPGSMRTTAVRQGDHYVINGMKRFITGADDAHYAQLIAATDRSKGSHGGISGFIVDMKSPGCGSCARRSWWSTTAPGRSRSRTSRFLSRTVSAWRATVSGTPSTGSTSAASATAPAAWA